MSRFDMLVLALIIASAAVALWLIVWNLIVLIVNAPKDEDSVDTWVDKCNHNYEVCEDWEPNYLGSGQPKKNYRMKCSICGKVVYRPR